MWKTPATDGFSSIAVSANTAATLMSHEFEGTNTEHCVTMDAATGKELWAVPLKMAKYQSGGDSGTGDNKGGDGQRSTPAISDGKVYGYGANLDLYCMDAKSGMIVWKQDVAKGYNGKNISWSNASSPLIEGDLVIVGGGGKGSSLLAFYKSTGRLKWKVGDGQKQS